MRKLAVFDMDQTLIRRDSNDRFFHFLIGRNLLTEDFLSDEKRLAREYYEGTLDIRKYYEHALEPIRSLRRRFSESSSTRRCWLLSGSSGRRGVT